ncbi:MAG: hypothetical protein ABR562_01875 [Thermoplasmatota archaeon]
MTRTEPAWTFYGRQGCGCCQEAANLLLLLLDRHRVTLRMIDLAGPEEAPASIHRLPALMDADGHVVWQGSFDSSATERAWAGVRKAAPSRYERYAYEGDAEPIVNGMQ